ncbi:MAG TPA: diguanylate cyclase [Armatimonadota bacterium]
MDLQLAGHSSVYGLNQRSVTTDPRDLTDYIPKHVLQEIQDSLSSLLRVPLLFATWDGAPITRSPMMSTFCYRFTNKADIRRPCLHCQRFEEMEAGKREIDGDSPIALRDCPSGLCDIAVPIVLGGRIAAFLLTSQVAQNDSRDAARKILLEADANPVRLDEFLAKIPSVDREVIRQMEKSIASVVTVIAGVAMSYAAHSKLAIRDSLTGLYNRAYMWDFLSDRLSRKSDQPFSLVMIDLNDFKLINDTHGHTAGDLVLHEVGRLLSDSVRPSDLPVRLGGDEFVLMLDDTDQATADLIAQRICDRICVLEIVWGGNTIRPDASAGCASFSKQGKVTADDLFMRADAALYAAKSAKKSASIAPVIRCSA